ncbi:hypothetical protein AHF37_06236 [Paragonimus kellicotti]|nr:hypothetical protein AHF37_06236 [Paragonimus kellicotti]
MKPYQLAHVRFQDNRSDHVIRPRIRRNLLRQKSILELRSFQSNTHKMTSYKIYAYSRKTNTNLHVPDVKEEDGGTQSRPCFSSSGSDQSQSAHGSESTISHFGSVAKGRTVMIDNQPPDTSNGFDNPPTKPFLQQSPRTAQHESDRADRRLDKSNETIPISSRSISRQPERPYGLRELHSSYPETEDFMVRTSREISRSGYHSTQMTEHNDIKPERSAPATNEECKALQNGSRDSQKMTDMFMIKPNRRGSATSSILPRSGQPASLSNPHVDHSADDSATTSITKRFWVKNATDLQRPDAVAWCGSEGLGKLPRTSEQAVDVVTGQWPSFLSPSTFPHLQQDNALQNSQQDCTGLECPCCGFSIQLKNTCPSQPFGRTMWIEAACLRYCQCTQAIHADPSQRSGPKINCCYNRDMRGAPSSPMYEDRRVNQSDSVEQAVSKTSDT